MGRIDAVFRKKGITAFIGFTVAGDPDQKTSVRIARALIDGGTDILELGVPFSDPVADGPTIQRADDRALAAGTTPDTIFAIVREVHAHSTVPIVLLTYYNTIYRRGIERFYREAHEAGVDGILVADIPVEESKEVVEIARNYKIDPIFLIAQTTSDERMDAIVRQAAGTSTLSRYRCHGRTKDRIARGSRSPEPGPHAHDAPACPRVWDLDTGPRNDMHECRRRWRDSWKCHCGYRGKTSR